MSSTIQSTSNGKSQAQTLSKNSSSDGSLVKEENFIEALKSQVDTGNIEDIIQGQKKSLERFEKTNEMLTTCCTLTEKRLDKARKDFAANKEQIMQAKTDLDTIFLRIRNFKRILAKEYPEEYAAQVSGSSTEQRRESEQ